jgi:hypothetical protein
MALASTFGAYGQITVVYRDDILLIIPVVATSLHPASPCLPSGKLSGDGIRNLVRPAREFESAEQRTSTCQLNKEYVVNDKNPIDCPRDMPMTSEPVTARQWGAGLFPEGPLVSE